MRYKRTVPAHVEERVVTSRRICDGCGADVDKQPHYQADEVTIEASIGEVYPEGDSRTVYEVDICGKCFIERVLPALALAKIPVRQRDADGRDDGRVWDPEATPPSPAPRL